MKYELFHFEFRISVSSLYSIIYKYLLKLFLIITDRFKLYIIALQFLILIATNAQKTVLLNRITPLSRLWDHFQIDIN